MSASRPFFHAYQSTPEMMVVFAAACDAIEMRGTRMNEIVGENATGRRGGRYARVLPMLTEFVYAETLRAIVAADA